MEHFHTCGASLWVQRKEGTDELRLVGNLCHDRFCAPCQAARAARMRASLAPLIDPQRVRFLTLTLRHSQTSLAAQIDRLYRSFAALKRRPVWTENVTGGVAFLEVKVSEKDHLWHVHLHCIVEGRWIDQKSLSRTWHEITGDSSITDIRRITDAAQAAHYVTKYVTKPADASVFNDPDRLDEMIMTLKGRRLFNPFGTWRKIKLDASPADGAEWHPVISLHHLLQQCEQGDIGSIILLERLEHRTGPLTHFCRPPPSSQEA